MNRAALVVLAGLLGCSAASKSTFKSSGSGEAAGGGGSGGDDSGSATVTTTTSSGFDPQTSSSGSGSGGDPQISEVFGHSAETLYRLDPTTKQVAIVGPFQQCSGVIDLAIDGTSNIFAATSGGLYRVDKKTAVCTLVAQGDYPNSLSFVPGGTLLPNEEALVGYNGSTYVRIDTKTGTVSQVGSLGGGYQSSGDIVSVKDGGTYLTVNGNGCGDCLVEVDPKNGSLKKNWGPVGFGAVYGLAYWAGRAYGFSNYGDLFEIKFVGTGVQSTPINVPNAPPSLSFWGAGSTTSAPVDEPK
ncbi:MAG: hypothetical protein FJ096_15395 [Deltaproteobacteria bacterium]|nr:hypothetical protein [Deltaproteobacteria bacterium]